MIRLLYFFMALFSAAVIDLQKRIIPNWMVCLVALISIVPPGRPCLMGILAALPLFLAGITIDDRSGVVGRGQMLTVPHIPVDCYNLMFSHQKKPNQEIRLISSTCNHNLHEIPAS